jgi:endo-1,4-beta-xylanase
VEALAGPEMVEAVEQHIENMLTHFGGKVEAWDVNNEMLHGAFFTEASGDPAIRRKMFEWAHARDPELRLFINDYNIISGNEGAKYVKLIQVQRW